MREIKSRILTYVRIRVSKDEMNQTKKIFSLYLILLLSLFVQVVAMKRFRTFPDIILLSVVFTGIFLGKSEGAKFGCIAGFLRGCFSPDTLILDIFLFGFLGICASFLSGMVYRQNVFIQVVTVIAVFLTGLAAHTIFLNTVSVEDIKISFILFENWKNLVLTSAIAPIFFAFLKEVLGITAD